MTAWCATRVVQADRGGGCPRGTVAGGRSGGGVSSITLRQRQNRKGRAAVASCEQRAEPARDRANTVEQEQGMESGALSRRKK
eukprot:15220046-Alexandrium_andersonii.AAC.1